eukprot:TRINITY_DN8221_c0_g1_i4.p1 TRINITY_DN8221_c0_g1~~TRINITY_DN8221_c0_g1_i4.p1  ORF type:complete len:114 (-),score=29.48 TRINITY_DN8221_c0_g1_i4:183-524(-)
MHINPVLCVHTTASSSGINAEYGGSCVGLKLCDRPKGMNGVLAMYSGSVFASPIALSPSDIKGQCKDTKCFDDQFVYPPKDSNDDGLEQTQHIQPLLKCTQHKLNNEQSLCCM